MEIFKRTGGPILRLTHFLCVCVTLMLWGTVVHASPPSIDESGGYFDGKTYRCAKEPCFSMLKMEQASARKRRPFAPEEWPFWVNKEIDETYKHCLDQRERSFARFSETRPKHQNNDPCQPVLEGLWRDAYSGKKVEQIDLLEVDHLISPQEAHSYGAYVWSETKRKRFANSSKNVVVVSKKEKASRAGRSPMKWLPPHQRYWCDFIVQREMAAREFSLRFPDLVTNLHKKIKTLYCKF